MKQEMKIFENEEFGQIRTVMGINGEPLFCLVDVCRVLELMPSKVVQRLAKDVLSKYPLLSKGGKQQFNFINEDGLYDVILDSRKQEARKFRKWVTAEVLPAIRKQGGYMIAGHDETDQMILARALNIMQVTLDRRDEQLCRQDETLALLQPKADYTDEVLDSVSCLTTTQVAKELETSAIVLNRRLCELGIQYFQSGQYMLYADYARCGYAKNRTHGYYNADGEYCTRSYLVWTERGREFIHRLMSEYPLRYA